MSIAEVLKHTPEELAQKLGNSSEAGEDYAAQLWASAKRAQTDAALGKTSVQAIQRLNQWRQVLNSWQDLKLHAKGIESGGGSMWGHLSARNDADIEAFLAKHVSTLSAEPTEGGKPFESNYLKTIHALIDAGTKEFKEMDYLQEMAASTKKELQTAYANLQYLLRTLPEGDVKKAVIKLVAPTPEK